MQKSPFSTNHRIWRNLSSLRKHIFSRLWACFSTGAVSCEQESSRLDRLSLIYLLHCPGCINDPVTALSWTDLSDQEDLESSVEAHLDAPIISHGIRQDLRPLSQRVALPVESIKPVSLDGLRPHSVKVRLSSWSDTTGQMG